MRYLLILLITAFSCALHAQQPQGTPNVNNFLYNKFDGYVRIDSGLLIERDTNWIPITPAFTIWQHAAADTMVWYYNGHKWQKIAAPYTGFVLYSDSTIVFVTPTQLNDSLGNYVTLNTSQRVDADKTWKAIQTFSDDIESNRQITNKTDSTEKNTFIKTDSLQNTGFDYSTSFRNILRNLNYSSQHLMQLPEVLAVNQSLTVYKAGDTLNDLFPNRGGLTSLLTFIKKNDSEDTLNLTNTNAAGALKAFVPSLSITGDSNNVFDNSTYWNINIPIALMYGNTSVTNHGYTPLVTDLEVGHTGYLDNSGNSDSAYQVGLHRGIVIDPILDNGNNINQTAIAIDQQGAADSIKIHTQNIKVDNLQTSLTPAFNVLQDAGGNLLHKAYYSASSALDFTSTAAQTSSDLTVTVTGATTGDPVSLGAPNSAYLSDISYTAWVSAANTVTVRLNNYSSVSKDPPSAIFKVIVTPL